MPKLHLPKFYKAQKGRAPEGSSKEPLPKPASNHRGQNALAHQHYPDGLPIQNFAKVWGVDNGPMNLSPTDQIIKEVEKLSITQTPPKETGRRSARLQTHGPLTSQEAATQATMQANYVRAVKDEGRCEPRYKKGDILRNFSVSYDTLTNDAIFTLRTLKPPGTRFWAAVKEFVPADQAEADAVGRAATTDEERETFRWVYGEDEDVEECEFLMHGFF
ncbi:MAG: hypothetical protein ASARMPRED_006289 [Alectoria sarmentosa]|nr:MAG: hypothetical protein ASARMPRED_006289 [Alectoria sarmentosa]